MKQISYKRGALLKARYVKGPYVWIGIYPEQVVHLRVTTRELADAKKRARVLEKKYLKINNRQDYWIAVVPQEREFLGKGVGFRFKDVIAVFTTTEITKIRKIKSRDPKTKRKRKKK